MNTLLEPNMCKPLYPKLHSELCQLNSRGVMESLYNFHATVITNYNMFFYQHLRHQQKYKVSHLAKHHHLYTINKHRVRVNEMNTKSAITSATKVNFMPRIQHNCFWLFAQLPTKSLRFIIINFNENVSKLLSRWR